MKFYVYCSFAEAGKTRASMNGVVNQIYVLERVAPIIERKTLLVLSGAKCIVED